MPPLARVILVVSCWPVWLCAARARRPVSRAARVSAGGLRPARLGRLEDVLVRSRPTVSLGTPGSGTAAAEWLDGVELLVAQGRRSPTTAQPYRLTLTTHIAPGLGELRLRELTVPRLDRFVQTVRLHKGAPTATLVRTAVSGVLGVAVRHGAIASNPVRDIGRVDAPARAPRALTPDEQRE